MIDFASTRETADAETKRAAHFLAAAVVQFIRDAATRPSAQENSIGRNINPDAASAIKYLFEAGSPFEDHIDLIGASCAAFRAALLDDRPLLPASPFTTEQRRIIQLRYRWWALSLYNPLKVS